MRKEVTLVRLFLYEAGLRGEDLDKVEEEIMEQISPSKKTLRSDGLIKDNASLPHQVDQLQIEPQSLPEPEA